MNYILKDRERRERIQTKINEKITAYKKKNEQNRDDDSEEPSEFDIQYSDSEDEDKEQQHLRQESIVKETEE